jgi:hypothetical protein
MSSIGQSRDHIHALDLLVGGMVINAVCLYVSSHRSDDDLRLEMRLHLFGAEAAGATATRGGMSFLVFIEE